MAGEVKINDRELRRFNKRVQSMLKGVSFTVGVQGKEAAEMHEKGDVPMTVIAAVHEFGSTDGRIPERSYLRSTFDENRRKYERMIRDGAKGVLKGKTAAKKTAFATGETVRADVIKRIKSNIPPPLAESTISRKGSSVALIDTGQLIASITSIVHEGKKKA